MESLIYKGVKLVHILVSVHVRSCVCQPTRVKGYCSSH